MVITAVRAVTLHSLVVITSVPAPTAFLQIQVSLLLSFSYHPLLSTLSHITHFSPHFLVSPTSLHTFSYHPLLSTLSHITHFSPHFLISPTSLHTFSYHPLLSTLSHITHFSPHFLISPTSLHTFSASYSYTLLFSHALLFYPEYRRS